MISLIEALETAIQKIDAYNSTSHAAGAGAVSVLWLGC